MIRPLALLIALAGLAAAPAHACRIAPGPPPVLMPLFWSAPPPTLLPGEVVLEVVFDRAAPPPEPVAEREGDDIVIIGCGTPGAQVYRVIRVIVGEFAASEVYVLGDAFSSDGAAPGRPPILVGRLVPYVMSSHQDGRPIRYNPAETFVPRLPPQ